MQVQKINNEMSFGMKGINGKEFKFKLSSETLKLISESTRLSVEELHRLPMEEAERLMKKRAPFKDKIKLWFRELRERLGFLEKRHKYNDLDKEIDRIIESYSIREKIYDKINRMYGISKGNKC